VPQSFVALNCHFIFSTKNREPLIRGDLAPRLYEYLGGIIRGECGALLAAGGMPDHVHLVVSLEKQVAVADALRAIKSNSSKWVHETFSELRGFGWQNGYGAFAVSYSNLGRVNEYVAGRAEHHRVRTFQEEFIAFLKRHNIQYDERYLWE
jgi:putative transposase